MPRILGIDSSLTATGLARIDVTPAPAIPGVTDGMVGTRVCIEVATVGAPKPTKDKSKVAMVRRVNALIEEVESCFLDGRIDAVGIEGLAYGAKGEGAWVLPWVWGRCLELCERYAIPLTVVATSARAKYATGKGNADKDTVLLSTSRLFPEVDLSNNNEADALIVGAAVCHQLGHPIVPVTDYRLAVLTALGT